MAWKMAKVSKTAEDYWNWAETTPKRKTRKTAGGGWEAKEASPNTNKLLQRVLGMEDNLNEDDDSLTQQIKLGDKQRQKTKKLIAKKLDGELLHKIINRAQKDYLIDLVELELKKYKKYIRNVKLGDSFMVPSWEFHIKAIKRIISELKK